MEIDLQKQAARVIEAGPQGGEGWVGRWLSRSKELEASLGKREALTARLLVVQLSLVSGYVTFFFGMRLWWGGGRGWLMRSVRKMHSQAEIMARLETQVGTNKHEIEDLRGRLNHYEFSFSFSGDEEKGKPI